MGVSGPTGWAAGCRLRGAGPLRGEPASLRPSWCTAVLCRAAGPALMSAVALGLTGCGTDVRGLLHEDGRLAMEAQMLTMEAPSGLAAELQRIDAEKQEACRFLYQEVNDRIAAGEPDLGDAILTDFGELFVRVVPIGRIEACADAQRRYAEAVEALRQHLPQHPTGQPETPQAPPAPPVAGGAPAAASGR